MRDVAARAKVSVGTVSKCLRGVSGIPPKTREAVIRIADEMRYRPNPLVSALMQSRRKRTGASCPKPVLAFVTAFPTANAWEKSDSPLIRLLYDGACTRAAERGYGLAHHWLFRDGMTNQRFGEMLRARGVRGLFLTPLPRLDMVIDLPWQHFAVVAHGLSVAHPVFHRTSNDHYQSMMLAMRECRRCGYQRPGFAMDGPLSQRLEHRWEAAFVIGREKLGFDTSVPSLLYDRWDPAEVCGWVRREQPDVIVGLLLKEQYKQLVAHGLRPPDQVGLVSLSVHELGGALTGIHQDARLLGRIAVEKLIDQVERNEIGVPAVPITLTVEGRWNTGQTLREPALSHAADHAI